MIHEIFLTIKFYSIFFKYLSCVQYIYKHKTHIIKSLKFAKNQNISALLKIIGN